MDFSLRAADGQELPCCYWEAEEDCRGTVVLVHGMAEHARRYGAFAGALAAGGELSLVPMMAAIVVYTIGAGVASPNALTLAVSVNRKVTGSASGLYGSTQMVVGALCTAGMLPKRPA